MQDLSALAKNGPWVTSQAGGNMMSSNEQAMTGKGTEPADPLPGTQNQGDPTVGVTGKVGVGALAHPIAKSFTPSPVAWKTTGA